MATTGHVAQLYLDNHSGKWTARFNGRVLASSPNKDYVVNNIRMGRCTKARNHGVVDVKEIGEVEVDTLSGKIQTVSKHPINKRFEYLTNIVDMVAMRDTPSAIVIGDGGLGKTFTVIETLEAAGLQNISNLSELPIGPLGNDAKLFTIVKGYSTPKGLFRTLFENRNRTLIFDDCDSVLKDLTAINLLKAALDSYDQRIISWNSEGFGGDDDLPRSFQFTGGVVFISNMPKFKLDQALKTRAYVADVFMTTDEKIERMGWIITSPKFLPEHDMKHKKAALEFIDKHKNEVADLSFRTLQQVTRIVARAARRGKSADWKDFADYVITQS